MSKRSKKIKITECTGYTHRSPTTAELGKGLHISQHYNFITNGLHDQPSLRNPDSSGFSPKKIKQLRHSQATAAVSHWQRHRSQANCPRSQQTAYLLRRHRASVS